MANLEKLSNAPGWKQIIRAVNRLIDRVNALSNQSVSRSSDENAAELLKVNGDNSVLQLKPSGSLSGLPDLPVSYTNDLVLRVDTSGNLYWHEPESCE